MDEGGIFPETYDDTLMDISAIWPADVRIDRTEDGVTDVSNIILDNVCATYPANLDAANLICARKYMLG